MRTCDIMLMRPRTTDVLNLKPSTPAGLLCLSAYLKERGFRVIVKDLEMEDLSESEWKSLASGDIPVVGISMLSYLRSRPYQLIRKIKACNPDIKIVLGGVHASAMRQRIFQGDLSIDASVIGEGEETLAELLDYWLHGKGNLKDIAGLVTREYGVHKIRALIKDIDRLPLPDYDAWAHVSIKWPLYSTYWPSYREGKDVLGELDYASIYTSRGCIGRCSFCNWAHWRGVSRFKSADKVMEEIHKLASMSVRVFNFNDESFGQDKKLAIDICKKIIASGLKIYWQTALRADLADSEMLGYMRDAGCRVVSIGIESGSEKILRNIRKDITKDQIRNAVAEVKKAGLKTFGLFMVGNVGESDDTIDETIKFMKELKLDLYSAVGCVWVFPGTELEKYIIRNQGFSDKYWLEEKDGAPIIEDGFTREKCAIWMEKIQKEVPWEWLPEK